MVKRRKLNFRETLDYQYAELVGNEGLFLPAVVTVEQLPEGIFYYYIQKDHKNGFYSFSKEYMRKTAGMFFTKEKFDESRKVHYIEEQRDIQLHEVMKLPEEFFDFFQVKLTLDKQISLADERRFAEDEEEEESEEDSLDKTLLPYLK